MTTTDDVKLPCSSWTSAGDASQLYPSLQGTSSHAGGRRPGAGLGDDDGLARRADGLNRPKRVDTTYWSTVPEAAGSAINQYTCYRSTLCSAVIGRSDHPSEGGVPECP